MGKVAVVVTAHNRADYVSVCLESLRQSKEEDALDVTVFLIDNGSSDGTGTVAAGFGELVRVVRNEENRPLATIMNQGLALALEDPATDYVFFMNDDTSLRPRALKRLLAACDAHPNSLLTPLQLNYREPFDIDPTAFESVVKNAALLHDAVLGRPLNDVYSVQTIISAGLLGRREAFERVGDFDPLFRFYGLDDDYCNRARFLGFNLLLVPAAHMFHAHGRVTDMKLREQDPKAWWRRWCIMCQGSYLLRLKDPNRPLWFNYLVLTRQVMVGCVQNACRLWVRGIVQALRTYLQMLIHYPRIRRACRRHFDPARKV